MAGGALGTYARYTLGRWIDGLDWPPSGFPYGTMKTEVEAKLVTVYVNSTDQWQGRPLYAALVHLCQERGIAGATVFRGDEGYGSHKRLHTTRLLALSENLPVHIEIVDVAEKI